ncbi:hypothetical protein OXPF_31000 [Oxobacter pfennigii]|uniref:Uncharacterized protein n=1 Tax=Oxobacter pfennigii TaxID=36849 RepID=A0A0P8YVC7_9CLOT|nr:RloB domain-containing protein [Oxobacter pfennigii]KPU43658.1 hypothetical protein OXPF_31000 [Oxobacter pfennigii]
MRNRRIGRIVRDTILIVCGKTETEKNYFLSFKEKIRLTTGKINIKVINKGASPLEIVQLAIDEKRASTCRAFKRLDVIMQAKQSRVSNFTRLF